MTFIYQWFQFPTTFSVVCPNCGKESQCTENHSQENNNVSSSYSSTHTKRSFNGNVICTVCGYNKATLITWPKDAFWKFSIQGKILWAWSCEHAQAIADYIQSKQRNEFNGKYAVSLFHIPEYFKLAKHREVIVKKIQKELKKHKISKNES